MTHAFIMPTQELGAAIAWMKARYSSGQACTIDVQSRRVVIVSRSPTAANQIAIKVSDRPGWRRDQGLWLFLEVLEPCVDIEAELQFAQDIASGCGLSHECEVAEWRVVEMGFPSEAERAAFQRVTDSRPILSQPVWARAARIQVT